MKVWGVKTLETELVTITLMSEMLYNQSGPRFGSIF